MRVSYYRRRQRSGGVSEAYFLLCVLAAIGLLIWAVTACEAAEEATFTEDCLRNHPGSHVETSSGYKGSTTYYCLGPEGEMWSVQ